MRELRVEDALLYLDQVKVEFGDRPHIYNEFLDIMKTFKTQQIDTPGVIRRVSNLFQGNRRLVLGFNTFLPEGYRIEIPMDGNGPPVAVYRAPGSSVAHILRESAESQAVSVSQQSAGGPPPQQQHYHPGGMPGAGMPPQQRMLSPQGSMADHHAPGGLSYGPPPPSLNRQPQQAPKPPQHPMLPLNDAGGVVLRPMPQQQQQQQRPMDGGMGQHPQQLPGGVAPRMMGTTMQQMMNNNNNMQQRGNPKDMMQLQAMQQQQMTMSQPPPMQQVVGLPPTNSMSALDGSSFGSGVETMNAAPPAAVGGGGQPLEFDHAINYVTTIKRRFASEPETYKKFLEILHTYQKEQRGIKEVLDEVSELFEDHPDLLKEFTFFLPDAVQATAKMQLDQAAKESESRKRNKAKAAIMNAAQAMQRQAQQQQSTNNNPSHDIHSDRGVAAPSGGPYQQTPSSVPSRSSTFERENLISRGARYGTVLFDPVRPPRKQQTTAVVKHGRPRTVPELPIAPTTTEEAFFQHAKEHLNRKELASDKPSGSRRHTPHSEFLKCLHLFGAGVLTKEELTSLLRGLFLQGHAPKTGVNAGGGYHNPVVANSAAELMREFEEVLIGRGPYADQQGVQKDKSKYGSLRIRDFDLQSAKQVSPSYFTFPSDYPHALFLSHPGQTNMDESVLNSKVICVETTFSENGGSVRSTSGSGKHHRSSNGIKRKFCPSIEESDGSKQRCNIYEEIMFRIEDERFELDMAIERNAHALRRMEPFAKEAQAFREQEEKDGQPIGRLRYQLHRSSLNTIHINAIGRIYGDRGDEILQHLLQNPLIVLPIVYQRLKQKDTEWRNARTELLDRWSAIVEASYEGCLDTLCYFNRKALEKSFSSSRLLEQCKKARSFANHPEKIKDHPATNFYAPTFGNSLSLSGALLFQPFMEVQFKVDTSHKIALDLIAQRMKHTSDVTSFVRERIGRIFAEFLLPWFHYPVHWVNMEVRDSFAGTMNPSITKFVSGQRVCTIFGEGTVASFMDTGSQYSGPKYRVKFPFGLGHLSPAAILYAVPSKDSLYVRRDGIMVRDESSFYRPDGNAQKLSIDQQILFATERIYQFLRLYLILCSLISDTREHISTFPQLDDPADFYITKTNVTSNKMKKSLKLDFTSVLSSLRKVLNNEMSGRDFETLARKISREKVHEIATLPVLVDKCIEALVKMAEEDTLLHLFDYCHINNADPVAVQSQCLAVAPDAFYRVQLDTSKTCIRFCYLEGIPLLTSPDDSSDAYAGASSCGFDMDDEDMNNGMDTGDDAVVDFELQNDDLLVPESKRAKLLF